MTDDLPRSPLMYEPRFIFDASDQAYRMEGPSAAKVASDMHAAFLRDIDGKMRAALIGLGWAPPEDARRITDLEAAMRKAASVLRAGGDAAIVAAGLDLMAGAETK